MTNRLPLTRIKSVAGSADKVVDQVSVKQ